MITNATLEDLDGLVMEADCNDARIPLGAHIWDGARIYRVVGHTQAKVTRMVRVTALDTGEESIRGPRVFVVLYGVRL